MAPWIPAFAGMTSWLRPEGVLRVDTQHRDFVREEVKLVERVLHGFIVRVAFDIDMELRRREALVDDVAFQLRKVDAVGREAAKGLIEGGRHAAHAEHEGSDAFFALLRDLRLARHDD